MSYLRRLRGLWRWWLKFFKSVVCEHTLSPDPSPAMRERGAFAKFIYKLKALQMKGFVVTKSIVGAF